MLNDLDIEIINRSTQRVLDNLGRKALNENNLEKALNDSLKVIKNLRRKKGVKLNELASIEKYKEQILKNVIIEKTPVLSKVKGAEKTVLRGAIHKKEYEVNMDILNIKGGFDIPKYKNIKAENYYFILQVEHQGKEQFVSSIVYENKEDNFIDISDIENEAVTSNGSGGVISKVLIYVRYRTNVLLKQTKKAKKE